MDPSQWRGEYSTMRCERMKDEVNVTKLQREDSHDRD